MTNEDAKDEAEFIAATAKLSSILLPSNPVTATYALLYEAARRCPRDMDLFLSAAAEVFDEVHGI